MNNSLTIRRDNYEGVTNTFHYPLCLIYEGCKIEFDDIYISNMDSLCNQIQDMERTRKGSVTLDGGSRFRLLIKVNLHGGFDMEFRIKKFEPFFPGSLIMTGYFIINGENVAQFASSFKTLVKDGEKLIIERGNPADPRSA